MKTVDLIDRPDLLAKRIIVAYNAASPDAIVAGKSWYQQASEIADSISHKYDISYCKVCGVIAALSPAVNWVQNIVDACNLIYAYSTGIDPDGVVVTTYGKNKAKAISILNFDESQIDSLLLNGKKISKTHSFYQNIVYTDTRYVTIDRHAIRIALNKPDADDICITEKRYRCVRDGYKLAARKLGLLPKDLQAITWISFRENVSYTIPAAANKLPEEIRSQIIG